MLHLWLAGRGLVKDHPFHRGVRTALWFIAALASVTGYTVFEVISRVGTPGEPSPMARRWP